MRIGLKFAALSAVWGGSLALSLWRGGFSNWFLCYSLGGLIVYTIIVRLFGLKRFKADVHLSANSFLSGEEAMATVSVTYRSILPLAWLLITQEWTHHGSSRIVRHKKLVMPWFRSAFIYQYKLAGLRRGHYELSRTEAISGDIFGLLTQINEYKINLNFTVYPSPVPIWLRLAGGGDDGGNVSVRKAADAADSFSVREYVRGDPITRIDWKATARTGQLKTKENRTAPVKKVVLCLDASAGSYPLSSEEAESVFEPCVNAAAGLFREAWEKRHAISLICSDEAQSFIPFTDRIDLRGVNDLLATVRCNGNVSFGELIRRQASLLPADTCFVCLTPLLNESMLQAIKQLRSSNREVAIIFIHAGPVLSWENRGWREKTISLGCAYSDFAASTLDKLRGKRTEEVVEDVAAS